MPLKRFTFPKIGFLLSFHILFHVGYGIEAISYNYSVSIECLAFPLALQYEGGGLVVNPAFSDGIKGWYGYGNAYIELRNLGGNSFGVAFNRTVPYHSVSQPILLTEGIYYAFSAWVQIDKGSEVVVAAFRNSQNLTMIIGSVIAKSGCWSMIKGGLSTPDQTMQANLYFQSMNTTIELWIDNVSLQPFRKEEWTNQQSESTNKTRKRNLRLNVSNKDGYNLQGIKITIEQTRPQFPIGCAVTNHILSREPYQEWFTPRFTATTFENEMKWYYTERVQGQENYTVADAMVAFAKQRGVSVRGHNILWDNPNNNLKWARALSPPDLLNAAMKRTHSVISRYKDEVIGWDVVNENMHFSFFENITSPNASAMFYNIAQALDPNKTMFLNEYNTLEEPSDMKVTPSKYLQKIEEIRSFPGNEGMVVGIGLQAHFRKPDIPYMRACLDILGASKMPVWITELDIEKGPNQTVYLEEIMREAYSHPAVEGIILWGAWNPEPEGCYIMCLTDDNFNNLEVGDVVDKLLKEWKMENIEGVTDNNGVYESQVYHGEYLVTVMDPHYGNNLTKQVNVTDESSDPQNLLISI